MSILPAASVLASPNYISLSEIAWISQDCWVSSADIVLDFSEVNYILIVNRKCYMQRYVLNLAPTEDCSKSPTEI